MLSIARRLRLTSLSYLFTFCPPGPDDLLKDNSPMRWRGIFSACSESSHDRAARSSSSLLVLSRVLLVPAVDETEKARCRRGLEGLHVRAVKRQRSMVEWGALGVQGGTGTARLGSSASGCSVGKHVRHRVALVCSGHHVKLKSRRQLSHFSRQCCAGLCCLDFNPAACPKSQQLLHHACLTSQSLSSGSKPPARPSSSAAATAAATPVLLLLLLLCVSSAAARPVSLISPSPTTASAACITLASHTPQPHLPISFTQLCTAFAQLAPLLPPATGPSSGRDELFCLCL